MTAWPKEVRRAFESARAIGLDPVVTGTPGGSWLVAVEGEHVRATAAFEHRNGKTKQVCGELTVDGEPHPLAESWEHLREIWDRHELGVTAPAGLMEVTDPGRVPPPDIVRTTAGMIESRAQGVPVRAGTSGPHWVIAADGQDGDGLRLVFTRYGRSWGLDEDRPVQVVVNGEDRSAEAEGDIGKAMALAFGGSHPADAAAPPAPARRQPAARSNGVETRRMVVIRELPRPPARTEGPCTPRRMNVMTDQPAGAVPSHAYVSTACLHEDCGGCRRTCKYCDAPCEHTCHPAAGRPLPEPWVDQARGIARELLRYGLSKNEAVPPELLRRIDSDPALFWLRGEEQPPGEWR